MTSYCMPIQINKFFSIIIQQYAVDEFLLYGNGRYKFNVKLIRSIDFCHIKAQMNCDIVRQIHI